MSPFKKNYLIILAVVVLSANEAKAQTYVPFPTDSAFWKTHFVNLFLNEIYKTYELAGDTTIDLQSYHKIYETWTEQIFLIDSLIFSPKSYLGGMREQDKIVYFKPADDTERIIYDFHLGVGDTVASALNSVPCNPFTTITSITDVVLADGTFRKQYTLYSCSSSTNWYIEGVGNRFGPIPHYYEAWGPGTCCFELTCYKAHGTLIYPTTGNECSILTSTHEIPNTFISFSVYPNPFQEACVIDFGKVIQKGNLKVINELGQIVADKTISNTNQEIISAAELSHSGIYLLTFSVGDQIVSRKIVFSR